MEVCFRLSEAHLRVWRVSRLDLWWQNAYCICQASDLPFWPASLSSESFLRAGTLVRSVLCPAWPELSPRETFVAAHSAHSVPLMKVVQILGSVCPLCSPPMAAESGLEQRTSALRVGSGGTAQQCQASSQLCRDAVRRHSCQRAPLSRGHPHLPSLWYVCLFIAGCPKEWKW